LIGCYCFEVAAMGIDFVSIRLDNPLSVYYPGQHVAGRVVISISNEASSTTGSFDLTPIKTFYFTVM